MKIQFTLGRNNRGFTMVETVLAIGILSFAAVMGSRTLLDSTRSIHRLRYQKKASNLAEMVLQQYNAYSTNNYQSLAWYDTTNTGPQTAAQFFNRPDNFGYDGIMINTRANFSQNRSSCTVNVTLTWKDGGAPKSSTFVKTYAETTTIGSGAALQVYLRSPCMPGAPQDQIIASCPGLQGFALSAPSTTPGNTVVGVTDVNGQVLLKNVVMGSNVIVTVAVPNAGSLSDFSNTAGAPTYFAVDTSGNYVLSLNKAATINPANLNVLLVTDFQPTGQISGTLVNDDTLNGNPPVAGLQVSLSNGAVAVSNNSFQNCGNNGCVVTTDTNGHFFFNNVIPSTLTVVGKGRSGSAPNIQLGDPSFLWGYTNSVSIPLMSTDWTNATLHNSVTQGPIVQPSPHVQLIGWAPIHAVNQYTNAPLSGLTIQVQGNGNQNYSLPATDSNGLATAYNIITSNNSQLQLQAGRTPQAGDHGYYGTMNWNCSGTCIGVANSITFPITPGYLLSGSFIDDNPANGNSLQGLYFTQQIPMAPWSVTVNVNGAGAFSLDGYILPRGANPALPINTSLTLENDNLHVTETLTGTTVDRATNLPAPHTTINIQTGPTANQNGNTASYKSDANGYFNITSTFPFIATPAVTIVCDNTSFVCGMCPANSACSATSPVPVHIDTRANLISFVSSNSHGFTYNGFQVTATQGSPLSTTIPCTLQDYAVQGNVRSVSGTALGGITVNDGSNSRVGKSGTGTNGTTLGAYSGWADVQGHNSTNAGSITLNLPSQTVSGASYVASSVGPITLPSTIDPTIPISQDLTATTNAGSSGTTSGNGI